MMSYPCAAAGKNHPGISGSELNDRAERYHCRTLERPHGPSPHATGGAFDVTLRIKQATLRYVEGSLFPMAPSDADTARTINPDYLSNSRPKPKQTP